MTLDACPSDAELLRMAQERAARRSGSIMLPAVLPDPAIDPVSEVTRPRAPRSKAPPAPTEHAEQVALFRWIDGTRDEPGARVTIDPVFGFIFAVPNGAFRSPAVAAKSKAEGQRPGYPDIGWDLRRGPYVGFRGELKRQDGGVVSPLQAEWHVWLERQGLYVVTTHGWEAMCDQLLWYFHLPPRS